ncbi:hypothetical protein JL722_3304 [Aureococcus anophagefferens]|nr:hypothetical protein JL722_3304 [Aureococcus anophagefferens]
MHVIVRALLLPWIVTFAAAAGVVKLNTKADPVEAVVEVFKHLHPAASSAALAVAKNGVASVLKGLEASDTSTENVAFEDENERRRRAEQSADACSDITSREVCKNAANKADCSWSKSREKCKSKRKKCAEVKNKKTCHKKKYANICAWSFKKEKCRNAKCEEIDDERDCMSEGARKRGCKWKNNQERCIVDKDAGGGGSDAFTESTSTSAPTVTPTPAPTTAVVAWIQRGDDIDGEAAYDLSGVSVSLSADGTTLAVGAADNDGAGSNAGHARVFAWDPVDETWKQRGDDIDGEAADDRSGYSVSLSADGTTLAVGARYNDGAGSKAGHARVFAWDPVDETWVQRGDDIDGEAAYDQSGVSVSLSADGTTLAVGAVYNDGAGSNAGHARVFAWDSDDETWIQRGDDIDGEAAGDNSGVSVSLSADGTALAVGAADNGGAGSNAGHARVFAWDSVDDTWIQRGDDIDGEAADDYSGYSVSLSADGTMLAVGAWGNDPDNFLPDAGHARVFAWDPVDETWKQRGDDIDGEAGFYYSGYSVSLSADGTTLAVGAYENDGAGFNAGHARVFAWDSDDETWIQRGDDVDGEAAYDWSGRSVSLSADGTTLAVGAPYNGGAGYDAGHARVYSISL